MSKEGSPQSLDILLAAAKTMSDVQLAALEEDLEFYSKTGLIGVQMSSLLMLLTPPTAPVAA